jgi:hypothetical protein
MLKRTTMSKRAAA